MIDDQPRPDFSPRQRHTLKEFGVCEYYLDQRDFVDSLGIAYFQAIVMREMELWRDKIQLRIRDRIQISVC